MNTSSPLDNPRWSVRQVIQATLYAAAILILFLILYRFSNIFFTLFLAIVISAGIRPIVAFMGRRGLPRPAGVIILYLLGIALLLTVGLLALPVLLEQVSEISRELPLLYTDIRLTLLQSSSRILILLGTQLPAEFMQLPAVLPADSLVAQGVSSLNLAAGLARSVFVITAILLLCFYWTLESERYFRGISLWVPMARREQFREYITEVENHIGRFILGQGVLCLAVGAMSFTAYQLIGLPYAFSLAIVAGLLEAVPILGPILGTIPALLVAFTHNPEQVIWVLAAALVIQGLENYLLVPQVMKRSIGVNPLLVILTIAAFSSLFGFAGAIVSIPIAAIIQLTINRYVVRPADEEHPEPDGRGQASLLRYEAAELAQDLRKQLRQGESKKHLTAEYAGYVDSLETIARDLDLLLADAGQRSREA